MDNKTLILFGILLIVYSCRRGIENKIVTNLMSNNKEKIIFACEEINTKDKEIVPYLLYNIYDPRIVHSSKYYGMSIYQIRISKVIKIIGDVQLPNKVNYIPDSTIVNYCVNWARKNGYGLTLDSLLNIPISH